MPAACYLAADVARPEQVLIGLRERLTALGPLTGLVFLQRFRGEGDAWVGELQTSLSATRFLIDHLAGDFRADGQGAIVVVASNAARYVACEQPVGYHVVKAGLVQLVRYYAATLGRKGIRVNAVSPCAILKEESKHPATMRLRWTPCIDGSLHSDAWEPLQSRPGDRVPVQPAGLVYHWAGTLC